VPRKSTLRARAGAASRHHRTIGVIMLDVDHFKRVNDDFGHPAGDMVLRELAGVIRRVARRSDVACREGGEEFLLLMSEVTLEGMLGKAEELRQELARLELAYEGRPLGNLTVSARVAILPASRHDRRRAHTLRGRGAVRGQGRRAQPCRRARRTRARHRTGLSRPEVPRCIRTPAHIRLRPKSAHSAARTPRPAV
jgi:diguanylate cyclase (GGDEF)-like protein